MIFSKLMSMRQKGRKSVLYLSHICVWVLLSVVKSSPVAWWDTRGTDRHSILFRIANDSPAWASENPHDVITNHRLTKMEQRGERERYWPRQLVHHNLLNYCLQFPLLSKPLLLTNTQIYHPITLHAHIGLLELNKHPPPGGDNKLKTNAWGEKNKLTIHVFQNIHFGVTGRINL